MELNFIRWNLSPPRGPSASKLLFLHGMGGVGSLWRPISSQIESEFDILAPDQRGHGGSQEANAKSFSPLDYGKDVVDTMASQNFHPAWVTGHSMGVRTATALAHLKPEWVKGLLLIDLGLSQDPGGNVGKELKILLTDMPDAFSTREEMRSWLFSHSPDPAIALYLMAVAKNEAGLWTLPFSKSNLIQTIEDAKNFDMRPWIMDFANLKKPVWILRGEKSKVYGEESYLSDQDFFKENLWVKFKEIKGAGHGLPFEKRTEFIEILKAWVESGKS